MPNFVCPISNAPCSLEITAECVETPESGVTTTRHESEVVYRDSAGRLRWDLNHPAPELNEPGDVIQIVDATAGFIAVLIPIAKCAFRQTFPAGSLGPNPPGASILGGPAAALSLEPGKKTIKKKTLGKQVIEGIEFEGELTTVTVAGERTVVATDESWFSKELGLYGLRITTSRGRKTTSKIQKVDRNEPDPSLFAIPAEYVIQDNSFGAPDIVTPDIAAPDIAAPDK